jgi:predicted lipid-binding transport protein (Tim44 family)
MSHAVSCFARIAVVAALTGVTVFASVDGADARRAGGSGFGSRGTRTFEAPPVTRTAPAQAAPIERSMTTGPQTAAPVAAQPSATQPFGAQRPGGLFGGFGRSMIGGLVAGGLLGMMLGHGFGGGFGILGMLLQIVLIFMALSFAMRFFASQRLQSHGTAAQSGNRFPISGSNTSFGQPPNTGTAAAPKQARAGDEIGLLQRDLDRFEQLLTEVQTAYGAEDYAALRRLTTPEAMSYLAEELGEHATSGVRNIVSEVKLLQGDVAEAWREEGAEYATLAMRYSAVDAMVDRATGRVVSGDDRRARESTEVWTFVRKPASDWKLAAIQGTEQHAA